MAAAEDEAFIRDWDGAPGERLYRTLSPTADFRYVEVSTHGSDRAPKARTSFPSYAALYEVVAR